MSLIVIRADASTEIGTGHVSRCLTLAEELQQRDCQLIFLMRRLNGDMIEYVRNKGFRVIELNSEIPVDETLSWKQDADVCSVRISSLKCKPDWLIVDHYQLDEHWETYLKSAVERIMVIDDLANRTHLCSVLLDQNLYTDAESRYSDLVNNDALQLLGPRYVLLRQEFFQCPANFRKYQSPVKKVLIFYGGSDPTGETLKAIEALSADQFRQLDFDVIVGNSCADYDRIEAECTGLPNFSFYCQVENIAELMSQADLSLGACGGSTWERCYLGLPAIVTIIADNQRVVAQTLDDMGAVVNLGWHEKVSARDIRSQFTEVIESIELLSQMSRTSYNLMHMEGFQGTDYVASLLTDRNT